MSKQDNVEQDFRMIALTDRTVIVGHISMTDDFLVVDNAIQVISVEKAFWYLAKLAKSGPDSDCTLIRAPRVTFIRADCGLKCIIECEQTVWSMLNLDGREFARITKDGELVNALSPVEKMRKKEKEEEKGKDRYEPISEILSAYGPAMGPGGGPYMDG
jgi:hypothetical protein